MPQRADRFLIAGRNLHLNRSTVVCRLLLFVLLMGLSSACSLSIGTSTTDATLAPTQDQSNTVDDSTPPRVTLLSPRDGQAYLQGTTVNIIARIENAGANLDRIQVLLNGNTIADQQISTAEGANTFVATQEWPATVAGDYTIEVITFRQNGSRNAPASATITVRASDVTQTPATAIDDAVTPATLTATQQTPDTAMPTATETQPATEAQTTTTASATPTSTATASATVTDADADADTDDEQPPALVTNTRAPVATSAFPEGRLLQGANIRSGPGTDFDVVGSLLEGQTVRLQAVTPDGEWYRVPVGFGSVGWISASVLETSNADDLPVVEP